MPGASQPGQGDAMGSGSPVCGASGVTVPGDRAVPNAVPCAAGSQGQPSGSGWPGGSPGAAHANESQGLICCHPSGHDTGTHDTGTRCGDTAQGHNPACTAMPRSFLVKKPSSTRIPNYGQLDTGTRGKAARFHLHRGIPGPPPRDPQFLLPPRRWAGNPRLSLG